jgi:LPS export ABC transporter protein LptC
MFKNRFWLYAIIIIVSVFSIIFYWLTLQQALSPRKPVVQSIKNRQESSDEFEGTTFKIPGAEKNEYWELHVNTVKSLEDVDYLNHFEGSYFVNKKPFYRISAETGVFYLKTRVLEVNGNVVLRTDDNSKRLNADELVWDPTLKKITARRKVILTTPQATIAANEIVFNIKVDQVTFNGLTNVVYQGVEHD